MLCTFKKSHFMISIEIGRRKKFFYRSVFRTALVYFLLAISFGVAVKAQEIKLLGFSNISGTLQLKYLHEKHKLPLQSTHPFYKETLTLFNRGYFVSPKILDFKWGLVLGLTQDRYYSSTFKRKSNGKFINGFFSGTFFKKKSLPLTVLWTRTSQNLIFDYGGYTSQDIQKFQLNWVLSHFYLPGLFWAEDRRTKENWYQLNRLTSRDQREQIVSYSGSRKQKFSTFRVRYKLKNIKDYINDERSNLFQNANIKYEHFFNSAKTNQWNSSISFFDRQNKYMRYMNLNAAQKLILKHPFGFSSDYSYIFNQVHTSDYSIYTHSGYTTLHHRLFQSLSSYVSFNGIYQKLNKGKEKAYAFIRGIDYVKRLPFDSKIQINFKQANGKTDREVKDLIIKKVGESHLIFNETPIFLNERNILPNTIVVYSPQKDIYYEEGENKDYIVEVVGDLIQISRTPFSRIRPEQEILVDYMFKSLPTLRYTTKSKTFGATFSLKHFALYYKVTDHRQKLLKGTPELGMFLRNIYLQSSGLRFTIRNHKRGLSFLGEQRYYRTELVDYNKISLKSGFFWRLNEFLIVNTTASYVNLKYLNTSETLEIRNGQINLEWSPTAVFLISGYVGLRKQNRTLFSKQRNFIYGGKAQWFWNTMRLSIIYRAQDLLYDQRKTIYNHFIINFERNF